MHQGHHGPPGHHGPHGHEHWDHCHHGPHGPPHGPHPPPGWDHPPGPPPGGPPPGFPGGPPPWDHHRHPCGPPSWDNHRPPGPHPGWDHPPGPPPGFPGGPPHTGFSGGPLTPNFPGPGFPPVPPGYYLVPYAAVEQVPISTSATEEKIKPTCSEPTTAPAIVPPPIIPHAPVAPAPEVLPPLPATSAPEIPLGHPPPPNIPAPEPPTEEQYAPTEDQYEPVNPEVPVTEGVNLQTQHPLLASSLPSVSWGTIDNSIEAIEKARKTAYSNALLFNGNADVQLLPVAPSEEFGHIQKMVEKLTFSSYPAALSVTSAMRIFNPLLWRRFWNTTAKLFFPHVSFEQRFIAVDKLLVNKQLTEGFSIPNTPGKFGLGTHLGKQNFCNDFQYGDALILCYVAVGKPLLVNAADPNMSQIKLMDSESDSLKVGAEEFVIYNPNQILPMYLIEYQ